MGLAACRLPTRRLSTPTSSATLCCAGVAHNLVLPATGWQLHWGFDSGGWCPTLWAALSSAQQAAPRHQGIHKPRPHTSLDLAVLCCSTGRPGGGSLALAPMPSVLLPLFFVRQKGS